jgi:hypothetical protein
VGEDSGTGAGTGIPGFQNKFMDTDSISFGLFQTAVGIADPVYNGFRVKFLIQILRTLIEIQCSEDSDAGTGI